MDSLESAETSALTRIPRANRTSKRKKITKLGRPTSFTPEIGNTICQQITEGKSLRKICKSLKKNITVVIDWLVTIPDFNEQYAHARLAQADTFADEIISIADDAGFSMESINRARLRVDARKWVASKLKPQKYGERVEQHLSGSLSLAALLTAARVPPREAIEHEPDAADEPKRIGSE